MHLLGSSLAHGVYLERGAPCCVWKLCCLLGCQKASHDHMLGAAPAQTVKPAMLPIFLGACRFWEVCWRSRMVC